MISKGRGVQCITAFVHATAIAAAAAAAFSWAEYGSQACIESMGIQPEVPCESE